MAAGMFGNAAAKTAAELDQARNFLQTLIRGGRAEWRGYRTKAKAIELGSPQSEHAAGNAFDCTISGFTAARARRRYQPPSECGRL